jgi:penicillin-binding protein 2
VNFEPSLPPRQGPGSGRERLLARTNSSAWSALSSVSGGPESKLNIRAARIGVLALLLLLVGVVLQLRLWHLQVIQGAALRERSENNRIRLERMRAPRGRIFDRNGVELVTNRPAYNLLYYPEEVSDTFSFDRLSRLTGIAKEDFLSALERDRAMPSFQPRTIAYDLKYEQVARIEARLSELGGLSIELEPRRYYRFGKMAAHVLGTVGIMSPAEWAVHRNDPEGRFAASDYIGKTGLEKALNAELSGYPGYRRFESDARGRKVAWIDDIDPRGGKDLVLNLDFRLQMIVEEAFGEWKGAVVALDPRNGEVMAFHSSPSYDPNVFASSISARDLQSIFSDPAKPLLNRVTLTPYQPGSVFKTLALLAGFETGTITRSTGYSCGGAAVILGDLRHCWKKGGHGAMNWRSSLIHSCNVFYYNAGAKMGIDPLGHWGQLVGFGQKSGIELTDESPGIMPTPEWKQRALGQPWWRGETVSVVIGQGMLQITPLQAANLMASVSVGKRYAPRLVRELRDGHGEVVHRTEPKVMADLKAKPEHLAMVRDALRGVVEEGTGRRSRHPIFPVAGKTGTAQVVTRALGLGSNVPERYRDHNWFACYVSNGEEPVLAMTVFIQNGGKEGSTAKGDIAGEIIAAYMPLAYPERVAAAAQQQAATTGARPEAAPRAAQQAPPPAVEDEPAQ